MKNNEPNRDEILQAAAGANAEALAFLRSFARRAHWVDDLADEALGHPPFKLAEMEADWLVCLAGNPFFLAHRAQLVPAMVLALNAWVDSHSWTTSDLHAQHYGRDVMKGQWHEVVWLVAWLTGGWTKLREVSIHYRAYDFEDYPKPPERDYAGEVTETDLDAMIAASAVIRGAPGKEANGLSR